MTFVGQIMPGNCYAPIMSKDSIPSKGVPPLEVVRTFEEHTSGITGLGILDQNRFISGSDDRRIKTWNKFSNVSLNTQCPNPQFNIRSMLLLPDKACVAMDWFYRSSPANSITIYNLISHQSHDLVHITILTLRAVSKTAGWVASSSEHDWSVRIWEPYTSTILHTYGSGASIFCVGFFPDEKTIVCGNKKGEIQFWEITNSKPDNRKPDKVFHNPCQLSAILVMSNGKVATGSIDGVVRIWDSSESPDNALKKELRGHFGNVTALAERPDGLLVSGSSDKRIMLWNIDTGESWPSSEEHHSEIRTIAVFGDNSVLTGSSDNKIKLWTDRQNSYIAARL